MVEGLRQKHHPILDELLAQQAAGMPAPVEGQAPIAEAAPKGPKGYPDKDVLVSDSKKVVIPGQGPQVGWSQQDTIAPAKPGDPVLEKAEKLGDKVTVQAASTQQTETKPASAYEQVSDWAWWIWNTITGGSNEAAKENLTDADDKTNPFNIGKAPGHLTSEEREELRKFIQEMNRLIDRLRETMDDGSFDQIMKLIFLEALRNKQERNDISRLQLAAKYAEKKTKHKAHIEQANKLLASIKRNTWWSEVEQYASKMGLVMAAATVFGSATPGWGSVALVYAAGVLYNDYKKNAVERGLSKGLASAGSTVFGWDQKNTEKSSFEILKSGLGVISLMLTAGIIGFEMRALQGAGMAVQGAAHVVHAGAEYEANLAIGELEYQDSLLDIIEKGISKGIGEWKGIQKQTLTLYQLLRRWADRQQDAAKIFN